MDKLYFILHSGLKLDPYLTASYHGLKILFIHHYQLAIANVPLWIGLMCPRQGSWDPPLG